MCETERNIGKIIVEQDLVIGIHAIKSILENSKRIVNKVYATEDGLALIKPLTKNLKVELLAPHALQEKAKEYFKEKQLEYQRVSSGVFLLAEQLVQNDIGQLYKNITDGRYKKVLCLDQISDVHNAAAILRTAAFYNVDAVIVPGKRSFSMTPSFFKIASGATEYVNIYPVSNMSKTVAKMNELGALTIALSEHSEENLNEKLSKSNAICLILGKEDTGVSHAVMRNAQATLSLKSQGQIKSLNVSIAAAIAMEQCFS